MRSFSLKNSAAGRCFLREAFTRINTVFTTALKCKRECWKLVSFGVTGHTTEKYARGKSLEGGRAVLFVRDNNSPSR